MNQSRKFELIKIRKKSIVLPNSEKQHVNKKKAIKSKSRLSIFVSLNSKNLIFLPNFNAKN